MARSVAGRPAAMGRLTPGNKTVLRIGTTGSIKSSDMRRPLKRTTSSTHARELPTPHSNYGPGDRLDSTRVRASQDPAGWIHSRRVAWPEGRSNNAEPRVLLGKPHSG